MKLFGRSDINEVNVTLPSGENHRHTRKKGVEGPFVLECEECCAVLLKTDPAILAAGRDPRHSATTTHWATTLKGAPKTENEIEDEANARAAYAMQSGTDLEAFRRWQNEQRMPVGTARRR